jgi:ribosomal-protein-alanine N-acetyltransferase
MNLPAHIKQTTLETPRLRLRELNPEINQWLHANCTDAELMRYKGFTQKQLELEKYKVSNGMTTYRMSFKQFQLVEKASGYVIGRCSLHNWFAEHRRSEIGYDIMNDEWKARGFMKEAAREVVRFGFEELKLNRIEAFIGLQNMPSKKVIMGLGFTQEGILRQHYSANGDPEDSALYALLRSEYDAQKAGTVGDN